MNVCFLLEIFWNLLEIANLLENFKVYIVAILNSIRKETGSQLSWGGGGLKHAFVLIRHNYNYSFHFSIFLNFIFGIISSPILFNPGRISGA